MEEIRAKTAEKLEKYAERQFEDRERAIEGHPERYYSEYELAKPVIRSFDEPEEIYDIHPEQWLRPSFWDPLEAPFMVHEHPAPYVGPTPYFVPYRDEPASKPAPQL